MGIFNKTVLERVKGIIGISEDPKNEKEIEKKIAKLESGKSLFKHPITSFNRTNYNNQELDVLSVKILVVSRERTYGNAFLDKLLEIGLKKACLLSYEEAKSYIKSEHPSLIFVLLEESQLEWCELFSYVEAVAQTRDIPFVCINRAANEDTVLEALNIGVADCWHWSMSKLELQARVKNILSRSQREINTFRGTLTDLPLPDLLQMLERCHKTGVLVLKRGSQYGKIYFRNGRVVDADYDRWAAETAFYKMINWIDGVFRFELEEGKLQDKIAIPVQSLLMESMRRKDEQNKIVHSLPDPNGIFCFSPAATFSEMPVSQYFPQIVLLFNGERRLAECLANLDMEIEALQLVLELYQRGLIVSQKELEAMPGQTEYLAS
ncbi:MAG: DUF4388 domain-containing protein [Blastocatellia bacterium]|nr:DUF4388 domain-containing protein [Blastocatellia bacterium]